MRNKGYTLLEILIAGSLFCTMAVAVIYEGSSCIVRWLEKYQLQEEKEYQTRLHDSPNVETEIAGKKTTFNLMSVTKGMSPDLEDALEYRFTHNWFDHGDEVTYAQKAIRKGLAVRRSNSVNKTIPATAPAGK